MTTSRHAHNLNSIQYNLHFNSEDEYTEALVLTPHNPFRRYPAPKLFQDASQDYVLPLIPIVDSKRVEPQQKSTDPSEPMTTRRNKQMERMRTFSTRYRQVRAGILLIDVDNKQILSLFKRYSNLQASKMDIFLEISKQQVTHRKIVASHVSFQLHGLPGSNHQAAELLEFPSHDHLRRLQAIPPANKRPQAQRYRLLPPQRSLVQSSTPTTPTRAAISK